jgi:hypothetical protein
LVVCIHHIVFDALSAEAFVQTVSASYAVLGTANKNGGSMRAFSLSPSFVETLSWSTDDMDFWRQFLREAVDTVPLPCEVQRASWTGVAAVQDRMNLPPDLMSRLVAAAGIYDTTRFVVLLAAWVESLALWTRSQNVTFCVPVSGRSDWRSFAHMGALAFPIVLHFDISGCNSFTALVQLVRQRFADALSHQNVPFGEIVKALKPGRRLHRLPFFDVMFNYLRRCTPSHIEAGELDWQLQLLDTGAVESLVSVLFVETHEGDLEATLKYPKGCFGGPTVSKLMELFNTRLNNLTD